MELKFLNVVIINIKIMFKLYLYGIEIRVGAAQQPWVPPFKLYLYGIEMGHTWENLGFQKGVQIVPLWN